MTTAIANPTSFLQAREEDAVAYYLAHRGYKIVERGWSCFAGRIPIIAFDGETMVFVEIKAGTDRWAGFPAASKRAAERERLERIALAYLAGCDGANFLFRFDVVSMVVLSDDYAAIRHHINCFS